MNNLEIIRNEIKDIDVLMANLFEKRMNLAEKVAEYKKENNKPIFDKVQEEKVITRNLLNIKNENLKEYYKEFIQNLMDLSKKYQETLI